MKPATRSSEVAVEKGTEAAGALTRQPKNSKRAHFRTRRFKHHQNSTQGPQEKERRKKNCGGGGNKCAKFWAPTLRGSTLSGLHPFWAPPLLGSTLRGPHTLSSQNSTSKNWPKSKLAEVEIGQSRNWSNSNFGRSRSPPDRSGPQRDNSVRGRGWSVRFDIEEVHVGWFIADGRRSDSYASMFLWED